MVNKENVMVLWEKIREMSDLLEKKNSEIIRLTEQNQILEEKLRGKETDLGQMRLLLTSNQQVFSQEKKLIEDKIQNLMGKIDSLTSENH